MHRKHAEGSSSYLWDPHSEVRLVSSSHWSLTLDGVAIISHSSPGRERGESRKLVVMKEGRVSATEVQK